MTGSLLRLTAGVCLIAICTSAVTVTAQSRNPLRSTAFAPERPSPIKEEREQQVAPRVKKSAQTGRSEHSTRAVQQAAHQEISYGFPSRRSRKMDIPPVPVVPVFRHLPHCHFCVLA